MLVRRASHPQALFRSRLVIAQAVIATLSPLSLIHHAVSLATFA